MLYNPNDNVREAGRRELCMAGIERCRGGQVPAVATIKMITSPAGHLPEREKSDNHEESAGADHKQPA